MPLNASVRVRAWGPYSCSGTATNLYTQYWTTSTTFAGGTAITLTPASPSIGGVNFSDLGTSLGLGADGKTEVILKWGAFLQTMFDFLIIAVVLFIALKGINKLKAPPAAPPAPAAPPPPPANEVLLAEIRDLLKAQR